MLFPFSLDPPHLLVIAVCDFINFPWGLFSVRGDREEVNFRRLNWFISDNGFHQNMSSGEKNRPSSNPRWSNGVKCALVSGAVFSQLWPSDGGNYTRHQVKGEDEKDTSRGRKLVRKDELTEQTICFCSIEYWTQQMFFCFFIHMRHNIKCMNCISAFVVCILICLFIIISPLFRSRLYTPQSIGCTAVLLISGDDVILSSGGWVNS